MRTLQSNFIIKQLASVQQNMRKGLATAVAQSAGRRRNKLQIVVNSLLGHELSSGKGGVNYYFSDFFKKKLYGRGRYKLSMQKT